MNHIYRLIWSKVRQAFVVAAETSKASGKSVSGRLLALPSVALVLAGLTPIDALALNDCGTGPTVVCDNSGVPASNTNPYANGISYTSQNVNLTLSSGAAVNTTTGTPTGSNGPTTVGIGMGIPGLTTVSGNASITVAAGASVLISQSAVNGLVIGGRSTSSPSTGTVVNNGTVTFTGAAGGRNIYVETNGDVSITNGITGVLDGTAQFGIYARDAGTNHNITVTNNGQVTSTGGSGGAYGINLSAKGDTGSASLVQTGTVSTNGVGVGMTLGSSAGSLGTFQNSGSITGGLYGFLINASSSAAQMTATNSGSITALGGGLGGTGVRVGSSNINFTNTGTIVGSTTGVNLDSSGTLTNSGTITGTFGDAVSITGNNNALILDTGSILNGNATSTGTGNTLLLQGSSSGNGNFTGFNTLTMSGTAWTLGGNITTTATTAAATSILNGILTLTGTLTNSGVGGGTTIASGATLLVGNNDTSGTIASDVVNNGALTFNRSDDIEYANVLSGTGQLTKQGAGVLTLTGGTAQQGSVDVQAGTLKLDQVGDGLITTGNYTTQAGATTAIGLSSSTLDVGGVFTQAADSILNATLGASPDITAAAAQLDGTLIVNGFSEREQPKTASSAISLGYILLRTTGGISGDFDNNPLDSTGLDYLLNDGHAVNGDLDYELGFRLAWQEGEQAAGTGNFTLNEGTAFDIDIALANQSVPAGGFTSGWDGQSLVKLGAGRLLLSAQNSYTGSTTLNDGILQFNVADSIAPSSSVIVNGGVLDLNGYNQQFNRLAGSGGEIQLKGASLTAINASAADDSLYAGNITGDGTFIKSGAGNLTLSGNTAWVGNTELQGGGLILDGSTGGAQLTGNIIGQSGTQLTLRNGAGLTGWVDPTNVSIDAASQWNMTANSLVNNLSNSGTVTFAAPAASDFKTLTVEGDYQGNNGLLALNTQLGDDASITDKLVINGNTAAGTTRVQIANAGGSGAQTLNGIEVVAVSGQSDGQFVQTGRIVAGAYDYTLGRGTAADNQGNWYLTSKTGSNAPIQRPEASGYAANLSAANNMFVTRLHDRLGETEYIDAMTGEKKLTTMWLRNEGGHNRSRDNHDQLHTQANRYVLQIGGDIAQWSFNALDRLHLGIMAGYANSKSRTESGSTHYSARASVDGYSTGVYGTWYANETDKSGLYVDSWLQYSWFNNTVDGQDLKTEEYKSKGVTASVESGYSVKVGENSAINADYFVQPKAQVIWMGVKADDVREANGTQVSGEGNRNIQTLLGAKAFMNVYRGQDKGKEQVFKPFVEVNWIHNTKDFGTHMDGVTVKQDGAANIAELKVGADGQINKQLSLWGDIGQQIGNKGYSDTALMLGVKYSF